MIECPECRGDGGDRYSDYLFECSYCGGSGQVYGHAEDCDDDLCALNGDVHSCAGVVETCECQPAPTPSKPDPIPWARG